VPAPDDDPWCRPRGGADLSRHRRRACPVPQIQVSRGGIWTDVLQVSIRRDRSERQYITLRGRNDAGDALRSSAEHAAFEEMVMAQGLGHADRQAPRDEEGIVALARRLAVIMHRIWVDGTEFRWTRE